MFKQFCEQLESKIKKSYEEGVSLEEAESLAAEFLHAQIRVSEEIQTQDLDARMRKSGLKAIRAGVYTAACTKSDKKPTESALEHLLNSDEIIQQEQKSLDKAEVARDNLERYYDIFREAHLYYRQIAKGV